jgi:lycopene cyclase domain-containing protein
MTRYTVFNIVWLTGSLLTAGVLLRNVRKLIRVFRVSLVVVIVAFPWDYIAVSNRTWDYVAPGPRLFKVPLNDSLFIFSCSVFTSSILLSRLTTWFSPKEK